MNELQRAGISYMEKRTLTTKNIAIELINIMEEHIGKDNSISREKLFKKIFKKTYTDDLKDWLRWEFTKKAMHYLRNKTKCFVASRKNTITWEFFVVKDISDANEYCDILNENIRKMGLMKKKVHQAVREEWHLQDWSVDTKKELE